VRDLDRIREVREYRVTGPQALTVGVSLLLLVSAIFVVGYQLGRLNTPADAELMAPIGAADLQDPGAVLAEMMARRTDEAALSAAAPPVEPRLRVSDDTASPPPTGLVATDVAALPEDTEIAPREPALAVVDTTPEPTPEPAPTPDPTPEPVPELVEVSAGGDAPAGGEARTVVEVVAVVEDPTPAPPAAEAAGPSLPVAPAGRGYTVQVGAYETEAEAAETVAVLQQQGLPVFHVEAVVNGKTWHRVRVGIHPSRAAAEEAAEALSAATPFPPFVTTQP